MSSTPRSASRLSAALLCVLVLYERARFAELRARLRHPAPAAG